MLYRSSESRWFHEELYESALATVRVRGYSSVKALQGRIQDLDLGQVSRPRCKNGGPIEYGGMVWRGSFLAIDEGPGEREGTALSPENMFNLWTAKCVFWCILGPFCFCTEVYPDLVYAGRVWNSRL